MAASSKAPGAASMPQMAAGGMLYLVATPIGNLEDLTWRAARVLAEVDCIAAEDTRQLRLLLSYLGIRKPFFSYHQHNQQQAGQKIISLLRAGQRLALVSDAGMPLISDPGAELVAQLRAERLPLTIIPGPSALLAALALAGLPTGRFAFEGFLPLKGTARQQRLLAIQAEERTCVLYEAPHRLGRTLADLAACCGAGRPAALARELTKLHEEVISGS